MADDARVVKDARFASLHNDPRFARPKVKDNKVKVDSRFAAVLSDPRFDDSKGAGRKRAREPSPSDSDAEEAPAARVKRAKQSQAAESFPQKMYEVASDAEEESGHDDSSDAGSSDSESSGGAAAAGRGGPAGARGGIESRLARLNRLARGEALPEDYSDASSDEDDEGGAGPAEEAELEGDEIDMEEAQRMLDPDAPDLRPEYTPDGSETKRLALVNCDWDHLRAVDIFAALSSFVPAGGSLVKVTVYPSDYGMKRLEEEARFGPVGLKAAAKPIASSSSSSSGAAAAPSSASEEGTGEEFDPIKLRAYELNKMKYYYALIECDSVNTAISIYSQCDGMEFEATSNTFDLRFVPDDTPFTNPPRDAATGVPQDYEPPEFRTAALQSSKVQLTWDAEDPHRARALNWDKLKKKAGLTGGEGSGEESEDDSDSLADIKAYLASSSEDSEDGEDDEEDDEENSEGESKKKSRKDAARMRALLLGGGEDDDEDSDADSDAGKKNKKAKKGKKASKKGSKKRGVESDSDGDKVMTISFNPGLGKDIIKKRKEKQAREGETVFEAEQRKLREKRKAKKAARKEAVAAGADAGGAAAAAASGDDSSGDDFFADASGKPKAPKPGKAGKASKAKGSDGEASGGDDDDEEKRRARLEMLMMGDDVSEDSDGENVRRVLKGSLKSRERKAAKLAAEAGGEGKASRNYSLQALLKQQKELDRLEAKKARQKKATARDEAATAGVAKLAGGGSGGFDVNAADPRFAAALADPRFAIDPTAPQFKDTQGMRKIVGERIQRGAAAGEATTAGAAEGGGAAAGRRAMVVIAGASAAGASAGDAAPSSSDTTNEVARLAAAVQSKFGGVKPSGGGGAGKKAGPPGKGRH